MVGAPGRGRESAPGGPPAGGRAAAGGRRGRGAARRLPGDGGAIVVGPMAAMRAMGVMGEVRLISYLRQALPSGSLVNCPGWGGSGGQREVRGPGGGGPGCGGPGCGGPGCGGPSPHPGLGGHGPHSWNCSSSPRAGCEERAPDMDQTNRRETFILPTS